MRKLPNIRNFRISIDIKSIFFSYKHVSAFLIFISNFLDLHKERKKMAKNATFLQQISCPLTHMLLLSKESFVKHHCSKPNCVMYVRQV